MNNLDQIRAKNAIKSKDSIGGGVNDGNVVKKIPTMIINNGILAAAAFALETGKGYEDVFCAFINHLATLGRLPGTNRDLAGFIKDLADKDSAKLRGITAEAIAYLNYLRRFAQGGK